MVRSDNANVFRLPDAPNRAAESAHAGKSSDGFLSLQGVSKHYGIMGGETVALASIDLGVRRGEFMTIIGPSGCG